MLQQKKSELRKRFFRMRKSLSRETVEIRSFDVEAVLRKVLDDNVRSVMFYMPINNEVDILPLAVELFKKGKTILFPKIVGNNILPYIVHNMDFDFKLGRFNIPEPDTEEYTDTIDVVLAPGIVFDKKGGRIGHGMGFFDRFLSSADFHKAIGVAFDFQVVDSVPQEQNDIELKQIATQSGLIDVK